MSTDKNHHQFSRDQRATGPASLTAVEAMVLGVATPEEAHMKLSLKSAGGTSF